MAREARASSNGSGASPSKNLAIAIYSGQLHAMLRMTVNDTCTFHSDLFNNGMASEGTWSVTAVKVFRASCWLSLSCSESSDIASIIELV